MSTHCPCCASTETTHVFTTPPLPVAAALLVFSAEESCNLPRKSLDLWHCHTCGFLWNISFEPDLVRYDSDYEGTQIHSPHFAQYLSELASSWAVRFPPETQKVLEIGCGQGEFLTALASKVSARMIGYDPALRKEHIDKNIELRATLLPEKKACSRRSDIIISRMTLEHIKNPAEFLSLKQSWLAREGLVVVQVPNAARTMSKAELCELQYEHVNYFTQESLIALFKRLGLEPIATEVDYGEQHLSVFAQNSTSVETPSSEAQLHCVDALRLEQKTFSDRWHNRLTTANRTGQKIWLWGAGSRATAFCANLPDPTLITGAIDLNPVRKGSFVPGVDIQTHTPDHLAGQSNLCIIVMNSVYAHEIKENVIKLGSEAVYYYV
jgi:2-polyprenyl-3-methyl-5-hydroxy-6-metoxy-1,4-benzoquinol methylase